MNAVDSAGSVFSVITCRTILDQMIIAIKVNPAVSAAADPKISNSNSTGSIC
ncbi:unnamed protein product [marine sediment metagenome]|uniref:Uncharacterized protein n=1 Tax=marine sediment metagenome TaxID=412755 RepID=X0TTN1_9ZZZZ